MSCVDRRLHRRYDSCTRALVPRVRFERARHRDVVGLIILERVRQIEVRAFEKLQKAMMRLAGDKRLLPAM